MYEVQPKRAGAKEHGPRGKVLVLSGPTATGKTALSLELAKALGGEIVSADSMQVYRGMDIGTSKVTPEETGDIPHHLIDICDVSQSHNVVDFFYEATAAIRSILSRNRIPIVTGGTGFYIHSLIYGPPQGPPSVPSVRQKIEDDMLKYGTEILYEKLREYDPEYAATLTHNDRHKIIRALEIIAITGRRVSDFAPEETQGPIDVLDFHCWFIHLAKEVLSDRIDERCEVMMNAGLIDEVKKLDEQGLRSNSSAAQAIGYRQVLEYLDGTQTQKEFEKCVQDFKRASRRYAKRQFTWFRKEPLFTWLNLSSTSEHQALETIIRSFEGR